MRQSNFFSFGPKIRFLHNSGDHASHTTLITDRKISKANFGIRLEEFSRPKTGLKQSKEMDLNDKSRSNNKLLSLIHSKQVETIKAGWLEEELETSLP